MAWCLKENICALCQLKDLGSGWNQLNSYENPRSTDGTMAATIQQVKVFPRAEREARDPENAWNLCPKDWKSQHFKAWHQNNLIKTVHHGYLNVFLDLLFLCSAAANGVWCHDPQRRGLWCYLRTIPADQHHDSHHHTRIVMDLQDGCSHRNDGTNSPSPAATRSNQSSY